MPESRIALRTADRAEIERLLERAVAGRGAAADAGALLERGRERLEDFAGTAAEEYAAYRRAATRGAGSGQGADPSGAGTTAGLAAGVTAAVAFGVDLAHGLSPTAALVTGVAAGAAGAAAYGVTAARGRTPAAAGDAERAKSAWLTAVSQRGIRPFLDGERAAAPAPGRPEEPVPPVRTDRPERQDRRAAGRTVPPPRRPGDRSAAARTRALLEQSFAHLPDDQGPFVGGRQLKEIGRRVQQSRASAGVRPTVVVLHGPEGSGRTTLAVRAARELRDQFRGACVVDLRGAGTAPLPVREALLHLLNRLGAPRDQLLFRERQERQGHEQHLRRLSEQYQKHLTDVPVVIVLDDVTDPDQVRALVPERSESLVLVTAAEPFALELPGADVHFMPVEPFDPADAHALLAELAAAAGLSAPSPAEAARLRGLCAGLPIALRIAGAALPDHGSMAQLAADIEVFGPQHPVDRVLAMRYHDQPEPNRRLLRRLALAGRASFGVAAAAALLATDEQEAARRLAELAAAGLLENVRGSRYRPHDLVRAFAAQRLMDEEDPVERAAAHERLIRSYADLANTVIRLVEGKTSTRAGRFGRHGFTSLELALRWLDEESSFITAALRETEGVDRAAVQALLGALCDYCLLRGDLYRLGEISELAQAQQDRQQRTGRDEDRSVLVRSVQWRTGIAARQLGELDRARSTLASVVDLYFEAQHPAGAARALNSLGITLHHQGNLREAERRLREALEIQSGARELAEDRAWTLHALAAVLRDRGQVGQALGLLHESLALHRENESVQGEAWAHLQLGQVHLVLGALDEGEAELRAAGRSYALAGDPRGSAWTLTQLARLRLLRGEPREAAHDLDEAAARHRSTEDARGEAWTLYYLGQALEESGETDAALRTLERSRTMFSRMRDVYGLACARHHSARVTRDQRAARTANLRNSGFARQLLQDARQDFRRIGVDHGEAWSCVELAVIDAGNGRPAEALALLDEAAELFAGLGDRHGHDWAGFLRATLLPLTGEDGGSLARDALRALLTDAYPGRDRDLQEYAEAYALLLDRGSIRPGDAWEAWRLGMTPNRPARLTMSIPALTDGR